MENKKLMYGVIAGALLVLVIAIFALTGNNTTYLPYSKFYSYMDNNEIESAELSEEKITFALKDGSKYYTDNSGSTELKERLLLNDVKVTNSESAVDLFYDMFDIFFIVIFLGGVTIGLRRLSFKNLFKVVKNEKTTFKDVVGMDDLKEDILKIIDIMKNKDEYAKKGIKQPKGIILEGNPGNGKTLFARALAGEASVNFIATKGADFESAFMAVGPSKVRALFKIARKHAPVIIFIDEFDGIGTKRNYSGSAIETENTRIVTAMLNELDGFKPNSGVLVVAATNNSRVLDDALVRAGRFDRKYLVPYPNSKDRVKLIEFYSKSKNLSKDIDINKLADKFNGMSSAKIETVINEAAIIAEKIAGGVITMECILKAVELTKEK